MRSSRFVALLAALAVLVPAAAFAAPPAELQAALEKFRALNFRMSVQAERGQSASVEMQGVERMHVSATGGTGAEMIRIGDDMWVKHGGAWSKIPAMAAAMVTGMTNMIVGAVKEQAAQGADNAKDDAVYSRLPDASDGTAAAHVWSAKSPKSDTLTKFYVRTSDGLVHKMETSGGPSGTQTIIFDDYGKVEVKPPA